MSQGKLFFPTRVLWALPLVASVFLVTACVTERTETVGGNGGVVVGGGGNNQTPVDDTKRYDARMQLAFAYYQGGNLRVALEEADKALQIRPSSADAVSLKGMIYEGMGDSANAMAMFRRAATMSGSAAVHLHNYGEALCRTQEYGEGLGYLRQAADRAATNTEKVRSLAAMGTCYGKAGDIQQAENAFREALALDPRDPFVLYYLTEYFLNRNDVVGAKYYFDQLSSLGNMNAQVLWQGIKIARLQGDAYTMSQYARMLRTNYPNSKERAALERGNFSL